MEAVGRIEPSNISMPHHTTKLAISVPIPISKTNSYNDVHFLEQYSLNYNNFNPSKMSPPDDWKGRLHQRMQTYYNSGSNEKNK